MFLFTFSTRRMELIKQCEYDNTDLKYGDIVIFSDNGYRLGMIKSTYHDGKTDCSWHYVQISKGGKDLDLNGSSFLYKLEGEEVALIKNMILKGEIEGDSELEKVELQNDLVYYQEQLKKAEGDIKYYKDKIEDTEKELEKYQ